MDISQIANAVGVDIVESSTMKDSLYTWQDMYYNQSADIMQVFFTKNVQRET